VRYCLVPYRLACLLTLLVCAGTLGVGRAHGAGIPLARGWQHVPVYAPGFIRYGAQVVAGGPGVVAFVPGPPGTPTRLHTSADGRTWRLLPPPHLGSGAWAWSFSAAGKILIITGRCIPGSGSPTVDCIWASRDGGIAWRLSPAHLRFSAIGAGGDGAVAFSEADVSVPIRVWTSADGLNWRQLRQPSGVFAGGQVSFVAKGAHGLVAGGTADRSSPPSVGAGIWTSPDGRTWGQVPNTGGIFGNGNDGLQVTSVVAGPRGTLALGQRMVNESGSTATERLVWASPDGVHWRRGPAPFSEPQGSSGGLVAWQGGFVDLTSEANETVVWASADGLTWTRVGSDGLFGGTARITSATAFRGGVVAIGSFARHPQPACLRNTQAEHDLRTFHPAAFLWGPAASATIPAPAVDRSDPRALKLLPYDLAAVQHFTQSSSTGGGYGGAYVNLCSVDPALGRHRAYQVFFDDPASRGYPGQALSIITQSPRAARAGFRNVDRLFAIGLGTIQSKRELPPPVRIGQETRVFQLGIRFWEPPNNPFTQFAVGWRQGQVIGVVEAGTQQEAMMLAKRQLTHLRHG
jgi:hypothetical protein